MNTIDFTQPGGFPLDQDVFGLQQLNTFMVQQIAALCGPRAILNGCVEVGNNVTSGYLVIDGEVLPLSSGAKNAKLIIKEKRTSMNYEDGGVHDSQVERYVEFGDDGVTGILWADFRRNVAEGIFTRLNRLEWLTAPDKAGGSMRFWNKPFAEIPAGWREVTTFAGRFPMGRKPNTVGFDLTGDAQNGYTVGTGGSETHKLTIDEMPKHSHPMGADIYKNENAGTTPPAGADGPGNRGNTKETGGDQPHSILNPYRIVLYIEPIPDYNFNN